MRLIKGENRHLRTAISAVFAMQLLVSSLCFAMPAAAAQSVVSGHCHEQMMHDDMSMPSQSASHHGSGGACTHCDAPQNLNTVAPSADLTPAAMLLAVVVPAAEIATPMVHTSGFSDRAQAPPDSSGILFATTQRIRI